MTQWRFQTKFLGGSHGSVKSDPSHDLGMRKMLTPTPHFPNSIVWLVPDSFEMFDQRAFKSPTRVVCSNASPSGHIQGIKDFSVHIELNLAGRCVTDPDGG